MELRPGRRLEMSSHFMPLPRSSMIRASSSGDHLLCFFAGESDVCDGMLRFPPPLPGREPALEPGAGPVPGAPETLGRLAPASPAAPRRGDNVPAAATAEETCGGLLWGAAAAAADAGIVVGGDCWVGDTEDSFESELLRREAISTMTVSRRTLPRRPERSWGRVRLVRLVTEWLLPPHKTSGASLFLGAGAFVFCSVRERRYATVGRVSLSSGDEGKENPFAKDSRRVDATI